MSLCPFTNLALEEEGLEYLDLFAPEKSSQFKDSEIPCLSCTI